MKDFKYVIHNLLMDAGICTNADFGYGSFGEFEHSRKERVCRLAAFITFVAFIIYLIRQK